MKAQIDTLAMQVGGKDNETVSKVSEQQIEDKKVSSNMVFKLLFSPVYILRAIVKLRKRNDSNKGIKSESPGLSETIPDVDSKVGGNGNGNKEDVLIKTASNDSIIPIGENRIPEHDQRYGDF
jgi:hypothetical protein